VASTLPLTMGHRPILIKKNSTWNIFKRGGISSRDEEEKQTKRSQKVTEFHRSDEYNTHKKIKIADLGGTATAAHNNYLRSTLG
jgi:hypothetical protein